MYGPDSQYLNDYGDGSQVEEASTIYVNDRIFIGQTTLM